MYLDAIEGWQKNVQINKSKNRETKQTKLRMRSYVVGFPAAFENLDARMRRVKKMERFFGR